MGILGQMPKDGFHTPRVATGYLPVMPARLPMLTPPPQYAPPPQLLVETPPPSPGASSSSGLQGFGFVHPTGQGFVHPAGQGFGVGQQAGQPTAGLHGAHHGGQLAGYLGAQGNFGLVQHAGNQQNGQHAGLQHQEDHLGAQHGGHLQGQQGGAGAWPHQQQNGGQGGWGGPPPAGSWQQGESPAAKRSRRH